MVWLSVIVIGFLLLGRVAQTLLARCFEGGGPPCQLIEHLLGGLDSHSAVAICTNSPPFTDRGHGAPNALGTLCSGAEPKRM